MKQNLLDPDVVSSVSALMQNGYLKENNILDLLPVAVFVCNKSGVVISYNKKALQLCGGTPNMGSSKFFSPAGEPILSNGSPEAACLADGQPRENVDMILERPDGTPIAITAHTAPLKNDKEKVVGSITCFYESTKHTEEQGGPVNGSPVHDSVGPAHNNRIKALEKALQESEKKYRELADSLTRQIEANTKDLIAKNEQLTSSEERYHKMIEEVEDYAIILLDKNGIIQNWNKGAEKIKGYKESEIVGKSFSNFYLQEDRETGIPQQLLKKAADNGKALHEGWRLRKDGSRFWGSIVLTTLHNNKNEIIGFSKVTRDLTERKLAEDKLKEHASQLEFQNKELEQFAYAASHDLKEPLRKIHLYNSSIADNAANILDERSRDFLNRSIKATKRMTTLIEDLLTYSKTTANIESFEEVDLNEVVEEIKLMHKEEFEQNNVIMEVSDLPVIHAIYFQITQLLFNIISNSIKYKQPGGAVSIQIKASEVKGIEIKERDAEPNSRYLKLSVTDNGLGFDQQNAKKIFNIFQRLSSSSVSQGSGIGLAICKRIVQNHHGFIKATGKENEGARFDIFLPL